MQKLGYANSAPLGVRRAWLTPSQERLCFQRHHDSHFMKWAEPEQSAEVA
jgi:hypothetical protein